MADRYKTKTVKFIAGNDSAGIQKLKDARALVRKYQNDTSKNIFNMLLSIAGLFNIGLGVTSVLFNGTVTSRAEFLLRCERVYTAAIELLLEHNNGSSINYVPYVTVVHEFLGTYQGKNKGYIYKASNVTYYESHLV